MPWFFVLFFNCAPPPPPPPFVKSEGLQACSFAFVFFQTFSYVCVFLIYGPESWQINPAHPPTHPHTCTRVKRTFLRGSGPAHSSVGCRSLQDFRSRPQASAGYSLSSLENKSVYLCAGCCGTATAHLQEFVP